MQNGIDTVMEKFKASLTYIFIGLNTRKWQQASKVTRHIFAAVLKVVSSPWKVI